MAQQHLLDLVRRDVLAAAADRVLDPVDEAEGAVGVAHHPVAGVEPQVAPGLDGLLGHAEVAAGEGERLVGAQQQFAGLARRQLDIVRRRRPARRSRAAASPSRRGAARPGAVAMTKLVSVEP